VIDKGRASLFNDKPLVDNYSISDDGGNAQIVGENFMKKKTMGFVKKTRSGVGNS
jgi:hypothetical protein